MLLRNIYISTVFLLCIFIQIPSALGNCSLIKENNTATIEKVIMEAIEDKTWLQVSTRQEMEQLLMAYYTRPVIQKLIESAWNFVKVPSDWEYLVTTGNCTVTYISEGIAIAHTGILETDEITGITYSSKIKYLLVNTKKGWRISDIRIIWP